MQFTFGLLLAVISLLALSLLRTYTSLPSRELKYRAKQGDKNAVLLYKAASYGTSLRAFLWAIIGLSSAGFFVLIGLAAPWWFALSVSALLIWLGFVWLPGRRVTRTGLWLAARCAGPLAWIIARIHPLTDAAYNFFGKPWRRVAHTGIYDKQDLIRLLEAQYSQADNRIDKTELEIAKHAMQFGDILVRQVMIPRRVVVSAAATDDIGPVLMDELHDSGHSRFPVYADKEDNMVGTLYLRDLLGRSRSGKVADVMRKEVFYVHEEQNLHDALQAILKTRHHLLIVVNSFEEYVGILSIEDVLEQIIGKAIIDEFDQYEDLRAVADRAAKRDFKKHQDSKTEQNSVK